MSNYDESAHTVSHKPTPVNFKPPTEQYPCTYIELVAGEKLEDYKFKVGYKVFQGKGKSHESIFNLSDFGDINNRKFLMRAFSVEFQKGLLESYKKGGEAALLKLTKG